MTVESIFDLDKPEDVLKILNSENDVSQSLNYFEDLKEEQQNKMFHLIKKMGDLGEIKNKEKFRSEGDGIYAFKAKPDRFLCFFFKDGKLIITNAFTKKQSKLPKNEKTRALIYKEDYIKRVERGSYYHD